MKKFTEELNDLKDQPKKNVLKISESVRNPSEYVRKSLVHLHQPSLIFGNVWKSSGNLRQFLVIFGSLWLIFRNLP